jgi:outer membrane protein assembly factor BamB
MPLAPASRSALAVALPLLVAAAGLAAADNWPQWRGPAGDGVSRETGLPTRWSEKENVAWKLPLPGQGGATPVVWGDRLFLTSQDGDALVLLCVSTEGKELWRKKLGAAVGKSHGDEGNGASASPSTDGKHVWAFDGGGDLACFDLDGQEVWRFNAQDRYGKFKMQWGTHTSPLLDGDRLYLQLINSGGAHVICLNKDDGKEVWNVERKSDARAECKESYASSVMWRKGDDALLIVHGGDYTTAHRLTDGSEVWRVGGLNPADHYNPTLRFVASPAASADLVVCPSAKHGPVVGVRPDASGLVEAGGKGELWRKPSATPDVSSPLICDGFVYLCGENGGPLICLDAKTGEEKYSERLHGARYRASPVAADGKIYLTARDGVVTVVKAGPKFEKLAENKLPDETAASPVVSGGRIYLRGFDALWAIGPAAK